MLTTEKYIGIEQIVILQCQKSSETKPWQLWFIITAAAKHRYGNNSLLQWPFVFNVNMTNNVQNDTNYGALRQLQIVSHSVKYSVGQSVKQSVSQSVSCSVSQSVSQSVNQVFSQLFSQSTSDSLSHWVNQADSQYWIWK